MTQAVLKIYEKFIALSQSDQLELIEMIRTDYNTDQGTGKVQKEKLWTDVHSRGQSEGELASDTASQKQRKEQ
jgi:hypothetical protein